MCTHTCNGCESQSGNWTLNSPGKNTGVVAIPFSRGSSWPRDWTCVSCFAGRFFTIWATSEAYINAFSPVLIDEEIEAEKLGNFEGKEEFAMLRAQDIQLAESGEKMERGWEEAEMVCYWWMCCPGLLPENLFHLHPFFEETEKPKLLYIFFSTFSFPSSIEIQY